MKQIINDTKDFLITLTVNDIIFFAAIMAFIILVITMIYLFKINKEEIYYNNQIDEEDEDDYIEEIKTLEEDKEQEEKLSPISELIEEIDIESPDFSTQLLTELKSENEELNDVLPRADDEPEVLFDLKSLTKHLKSMEGTNEVDLKKYEEEQEEKAIISYDELIKSKSKAAVKINYVEEENIDEEISVKKVDLNNLTTDSEESQVIPQVTLVSYDKEEAFLQALKELKRLLS